MSEGHWVESKEAPPVREKDEVHLRAVLPLARRRVGDLGCQTWPPWPPTA